MSLKIEFVERASQPDANVSELCREFGISRDTGHRWVKRFKASGFDGLEEHSRRPLSSPIATAEELVMSVLETREAHPRWGPKKLVVLLKKRWGERTPSVATIARILQRFGRVKERKRTRTLSIVERAPDVRAKEPNDVWTIDFKGWWRTGDHRRCEPFTVRDAFSRYVLAASLLPSSTGELVRKELEKLFKKHGIPRAIQCDNGPPFVSVLARGGLTTLSAWWVALGIRLVRSRPACPQDNGAHERMHRDLRADVQAFPQATRDAEQRAIDRWKQEFNNVRPHEALGGKTPAEVYKPASRREFAERRFIYPPGWIVRRVFGNGHISFNSQKFVVGRALLDREIGLEPMGGLVYRIWFSEVNLGELALAPSTHDVDRACAEFLERPVGRKKRVA